MRAPVGGADEVGRLAATFNEMLAGIAARDRQIAETSVFQQAVLENAGLISRGREAQRRPCRLEPEGFKQVADWVEEYRQIWEASFDRLDDYLKRIQHKQGKKHGRQQKAK